VLTAPEADHVVNLRSAPPAEARLEVSGVSFRYADGEPRVLAYLTIGALKELLYQAVTLGLAGESTEALTRQLYSFLGQGYLRVGVQAAVGR